MSSYYVRVGIETHIELNTKSKAFCSCEHKIGAEPNTNICPVCMGLPGAIPSVNKSAVEKTIQAGLLFGCEIQKESYFERKNYFSPDLPKGYQLVQYNSPIAKGGCVKLASGKQVPLNRIHLEEATAKVINDEQNGRMLIDYNRSGVAVLEIVSEPTEMTAEEVVEYLEVLKNKISSNGLSDCLKEFGQFKFDISISISSTAKLGTRVEVNNLMTSSDTIAAIEYEVERQMSILKSGGKVDQETRVWDRVGETTFAVRAKENVTDYRHIKDPDIKTISIAAEDIKRLRAELKNK